MKFPGLAAGIAVCAAVAWQPAPARGSFHLWRIQEVFTNASGTIQFIELYCATGADFENFVDDQTISATSNGTTRNFLLDHNLDEDVETGDHTFLIATAGFAALPGAVAPDFGTLPTSFFNPNATSISINFAGVDELSFSGSLLPKNGSLSLVDETPYGFMPTFESQANSPTNFAGRSGSINAAPPPKPGDFNENGVVDAADLNVNWRIGFGKTTGAVHTDGDANDDDDVDGNDFLVWQRDLPGSPALGAASGVPEPGGAALVALALVARMVRRRR